LLWTARDTLKSLLRVLPDAQRYDALMVLNAMAISAREAEVVAREDYLAELDMLRRLDSSIGDERERRIDMADFDPELSRRNKRLAQALRSGQLDAIGDRAVRDLLWHQVVAKLRVSNPKYLAEFAPEFLKD
jgi:hypothetical protein